MCVQNRELTNWAKPWPSRFRGVEGLREETEQDLTSQKNQV